jgi:hypothetical protein
LVGLYDPVDGPEDVTLEQVFDQHLGLNSGDELEGAVVVGFEFAVEPQRHAVIAARVEHDQGRAPHDGVKIVEERVHPDQRPGRACAGQQHKVVTFRLRDLQERSAKLLFVKRTLEGILHRLVALFPLNAEGPFEELALFEVPKDEIEEIDRFDPSAGSRQRNMLQQSQDEAADVKLAFGGIVEDVERDLVSEPASGDELLRGNPRQDLIETLVKGIRHGDVSKQCST